MNESPSLLKIGPEDKPSWSKPSKVKETKSLGSGTYGRADEVKLTMRRGEKERELSLAKKTFKSEADAFYSFSVYSVLKKCEMKVPPTYRINQSNLREIFMTDYEKDGQMVITNNSLAGGRLIHLEKLERPTSLIKDLINQCVIATENNILLQNDCFFFIISPREISTEASADFVIADFDIVGIDNSTDDLLEKNLLAARESLQLLCPTNPALIKKLEEIFDKNKPEIN